MVGVMDLGTLPAYVTAILLGRWEAVRCQPPRLTRAERRSLARAMRRHGCQPYEGADKRAEAEGLELWEAAMPRRCGVHAGNRIYLPAGLHEADADLVIDHERTHAWVDRRGLVHATEADAWLVTADAVWTPGDPRPQGFPDWFLDAVEMSREPWRDAYITKVIGWA